MIGGAESGRVQLYNRGITSYIIGGWNTDGYKYGTSFNQAEEPTSLRLYATNPFNYHGGRTYTSNNILPTEFIGKTLHVTGYLILTGTINGGRQSGVYVFISDSVQDSTSVDDVSASGAFDGEIHKSVIMTQNIEANIPVPFEIVLPLTKSGYLSFVMYKGYNGFFNAYFEEAWIE